MIKPATCVRWRLPMASCLGACVLQEEPESVSCVCSGDMSEADGNAKGHSFKRHGAEYRCALSIKPGFVQSSLSAVSSVACQTKAITSSVAVMFEVWTVTA